MELVLILINTNNSLKMHLPESVHFKNKAVKFTDYTYNFNNNYNATRHSKVFQ